MNRHRRAAPALALWLAAVTAVLLIAALPAKGQSTASLTAPAATATPLAPPDAPVLVAPAEGGLTTGANSAPLGMPTFVWSLPPTGTYSHIQVSNTPGFSTILVDEDTQGTSYTPVEVWPDGPYYWRVKAAVGVQGARIWGPYSEVAMFTKSWSHGGAIRPTPLQPPAGAVRAAFAAGDFTWGPIAGAAGYLFEIGADDQFGTVIYQAETVKPQHTPTVRLANNTYYWRVTPFAFTSPGKARVYAAPSLPQPFAISWSTPPQIIAPPRDLTTPFTPRFQWQAVEGAKVYQVEISTDIDFNPATAYATSNTDFTPTDNLSNDKDYFWRVKATDQNGNETPWSEVRRFRVQWDFVPKLLTPADNQTQLSYPFFSWEPVPGAQQYQLQIDKTKQFNGTLIADVKIYNATTYAQPSWDTVPIFSDGYWRVRAIDATGNFSPWSETRSFRTNYSVAPNLIYPPYTYQPDAANLPVHRVTTLAWPVFVWDTAHAWISTTALTSTVGPDFYELMVDNDPAFGSPNFSMRTRTLAAAPVLDAAHPEYAFDGLQDGGLYFWRVRAYRNGAQIGTDARWEMRYDSRTSELPALNEITPLFPKEGLQAVGTPPVLGWLPVAVDGQRANNYHVQISLTPEFTRIVDEAYPRFVNYVPWQGQLTDMPPSTYWWRVRAEHSPDNPMTAWSEPRSFGVSLDLMMGNQFDFPAPPYPSSLLAETSKYLPALTRVASAGTATGNEYQLGDLHVMLDRSYTGLPNGTSLNLNWAFAFNINPTPGKPVRYGIYVDNNHLGRTVQCGVFGSVASDPGAQNDPMGQGIATYSIYAPEYVLYVDWDGSAITAVNYFSWNGIKANPNCQWAPARSLSDLGGVAWYDPAKQAIALLVPYTALGGEDADFSGSTAIALFSTSLTPGDGIRSSIPPQAVLPGNTGSIIDNPVFVSDMLQPLYPFDTPAVNSRVHYDMPAVRWRTPVFDSVDGYQVELARDERFSQIVERWETFETATNPFFAIMPATFQSTNANADNESYYWRVRIRHEKKDMMSASYDFGPWSPPMRFKLDSREVGNPRLSTGSSVFMTPTFEWDRVEGAAGYRLQVDDDALFGSPLFDIPLTGTNYTPPETSYYASLSSLRPYYWRVAMRRSGSVLGRYTAPMTFTKSSVSPQPVGPLSSNPLTLTEQPTFTWAAVLTPTETPRLAAPLYHLQVDDDGGFNSPALDVATTATSYTPPKGKSLGDGVWYWRVAMYEATGKPGPYSQPQAFFKQYPLLKAIEPLNGAVTGMAPRFAWQGAHGAAYYILEIASEDSFQNVTKITTPNMSFTLKDGKKYGKYFWRVQMVDNDGMRGPILASRFNLGQSCYLPYVNKSK
jgi:hypothetical protein